MVQSVFFVAVNFMALRGYVDVHQAVKGAFSPEKIAFKNFHTIQTRDVCTKKGPIALNGLASGIQAQNLCRRTTVYLQKLLVMTKPAFQSLLLQHSNQSAWVTLNLYLVPL